MKMRLFLRVLIILTLILCCSSCSKPGSNVAFVVNITSSVGKYALTMSSVPGLPLTVSVQPDDAKGLSYIWQASSGSFLSWGQPAGDFQVKTLGSACTVDFATVYWTPLSDDQTAVEAIDISLEVRDSGGNLVGQTTVKVECDGLYYSIR